MHVGPGTGTMVVWFVSAAAFWIGLPVTLFVVGRRVLRALERRSLTESYSAGQAERMRRLAERVEDLADQTERIDNAQRFTTDLLRERLK